MDERENLLGLILEREGLMTRAQVQAVAQEQQRARAAGKVQAFGMVALRLNYVTEPQLKYALGLQIKIAWPPGQEKPLGVRLVAAGLVKPHQLVAALDEQQRNPDLIGQILVRRGVLQANVLAVFLERQLTTR